LASNAGVEHFAPLEEISEGDLTRVFGTNVFGQLYITKAACDYMEDGASIVLTSSISAQLSIFHHTLYAASKAAVSAMARNLAPELGARGIRINAIAPGGTATSMASAAGAQYVHPLLQGTVDPDLLIKSSNALQRLAEPKEIAAAIAFLLSDEASFISGLTLSVDGGIVA
jgi:NAD(P)-dependent dehydrogenase (short-subunit alcohol dehydrogenase family)